MVRGEPIVPGCPLTGSTAVIAWLGTQLGKQKKNDFKPKNDDLSFARVNTEPCQFCCEMLDKVREAAFENLTGKNREVFLTEIGVAFHAQLLEHFKKFPVSATGGLMLAKDLKSYQDTVALFGLPALAERFEFLRQLGNVFLVPPETLKSYITENYLGRIDPTLLHPYLAQRPDWAKFESGFSAAGTDGDAADAADAKSGAAGLSQRFGVGRLASMMRDLEGLRDSRSSSGGGFSLPSMSMPSMSLASLGLQSNSAHPHAQATMQQRPPATTTFVPL